MLKQLDGSTVRVPVSAKTRVLVDGKTALLGHVKQSPAFDSEKYPILEKGLDAYLRGDALTATHLLIPQVEDAVRNIVKLSGGATFKPHRLGGVILRPLDDLPRIRRRGQVYAEIHQDGGPDMAPKPPDVRAVPA